MLLLPLLFTGPIIFPAVRSQDAFMIHQNQFFIRVIQTSFFVIPWAGLTVILPPLAMRRTQCEISCRWEPCYQNGLASRTGRCRCACQIAIPFSCRRPFAVCRKPFAFFI
jgi:hypothetical protein